MILFKQHQSIVGLFFYSLTLIALIASGIMTYFWISREYVRFHEDVRQFRTEFMENEKTLLKLEVQSAVDRITYHRSTAAERLKKEVQNRVNEAHAIAATLYQDYRGIKTDEDIKKLIRSSLKPVRFNKDRGYFFALDLDGVIQLYGGSANLEGKDMVPFQDVQGNHVVKDILALIEKQGEGFHHYLWPKPDAEGMGVPKISFCKLFLPLNWIIGTGEYLDDVEKDIQYEMMERLSQIRFGEHGYIFASTYAGDPLFSDGKITVTTQNIWNLTDVNGVKVIQEQRRQVENSEGGFYFFSWPKVDQAGPSPKIAFTRGIPEWGWMIGAGAYLDSMDQSILTRNRLLESNIKLAILKIAGLMAALTILITVLARWLSVKLERNFTTFSSFFSRAAAENVVIENERLHFTEFRDLARPANRMIAEQKKIETDLHMSEARYRAILDGIEDIFYEVDLSGNFTLVNKAMCTVLGYSREELIGTNYARNLDPESAQELYRFYHDIFVSGKPAQGITGHFFRKDGSSIVGESSISLITDAEGRITGFRGVARDITERRQMEKALRESESRYRELVEHAPAGIFEVDLQQMTFISVNDVMCEYSGYTRKEFLSMSPAALLSEKSRQHFIERIHRVQTGDTLLLNPEYQVVKKNGEQIWVLANVKHIYQGERITGVWVIAQDITAKKQAEQEKATLETLLRQAQKMESLGTLAGGIAHDFNNLQMGILGNVSLILMEMDPENPHTNRLKHIEQYVNKGSDLTRQLLGFARGGKYEAVPTDMNVLIQNTLEMFGQTRKEIAIHTRFDPDLLTVAIDRGQMDQVLLNLLVNACQAMPGGGEIIVETQNFAVPQENPPDIPLPPGRYVRFSIADNGVGMDKKTIQRIFDPFFTTKTMGRGTGLGLASAYGIIHNHGGYITVESEKSYGSVFHIFLPACEETATHGEKAPENILTGSETILFVDDEEMILNIGKEILQRLGYQVILARGGKEAIKLFQNRQQTIDMVILDMVMPEMGGAKTFENLKSLSPSIKVILSSGYSLNGQAEKIMDMGCKGFIQKPFNIQKLSQKIRSVLDS